VKPLLVACSSLCGEAVVDRGYADVGRLDHIVIDPVSGRIAYAVIARGGVFGIGQELFEVPWEALELDDEKRMWVLAAEAESYVL
jgi:sporulation protein YlmC with PRC-barrel domain